MQDKHWPAESFTFPESQSFTLTLALSPYSVTWSLHKQLCTIDWGLNIETGVIMSFPKGEIDVT